jgi:hypothetical protein
MNFFTCQQGGPEAREIPDANALQSKIIKEPWTAIEDPWL